jgi:adenylate cyclase
VPSPAARRLAAALVPGAVAGLLAGALAGARPAWLEALELPLHDVRAARSAARAGPGVALVAIDDEALALGGGTYPLPRGALAAVLEEVRAAGARAVALDLLLVDPLEGSLADENQALAAAMAGPGGRVALAAAATEEAGHAGRYALVPPLPRFAAAAATLGVVSQRQDADGKVRSLRHLFPTAAGQVPSLPLAAAALALGAGPPRVEGGRLLLGGVSAPLDGDGRVLVRWTVGPTPGTAPYPVVSAADLLRTRLAAEGEGTAPPPAVLQPLSGAVVVVAATAAAAKDKRPTPVNPGATGGEVLATAVDGLLTGRFVARAARAVDAGLALGLALLVALATALSGRVARRPGGALGGAALGLLLATWGAWAGTTAALGRGLWLAAAAPIGGAVLAALAATLGLLSAERRERRLVHDALGRYTSPALVRALLDQPELLDRFGGARQELTVLFSDLRGFTTVSEGMAPELLVELLNAYLSEMTEVVEAHGGYVDKYIGDAVMAVFGAPVPAPDHAVRACRAALAMRDRLARRRAAWRQRFGVDLFARAGVNTAEVVAGNVGSRRKANWTVLGDGVNLASRLEGANKAYGSEILVGDATRRAVGGAFAFRSLDLLRVKGKHDGVAVHELLGEGLPPPGEAGWLARWEAAVAGYRSRRFGEAAAAFAALAAERPGDEAAALYAGRCRALLAVPPPAGWDGVFELHDK